MRHTRIGRLPESYFLHVIDLQAAKTTYSTLDCCRLSTLLPDFFQNYSKSENRKNKFYEQPMVHKACYIHYKRQVMLEDYVESDYHGTSIPPHRVPAKSSPSAVCWRWGAHAGVWLEVDKHRPQVLLAFTFASATTRRGGASFKVGGLPTFAGVLLVDDLVFGVVFAVFGVRSHSFVCWPSMDRCCVFTVLGSVLRPFSRHSLMLTDLCYVVVAFC